MATAALTSRYRTLCRTFCILCLAAQRLLSGGTLDVEQSRFVKQYAKQKNIPKPGAMLVNTDAEPDLAHGFHALFNGKDLTGWTPKGGKSPFEAKDGMIVGQCQPQSPSTYLCTERDDFKDFIFTCDMKWVENGNTGVMFRAHVVQKNGADIVTGPQAEMEGFDDRQRCWSGGIYGQSCGGWYYPLWLESHREVRGALKRDDWNRLTIKVQGNVVKTWLNGVPAAHWVDDGSYPRGFFGLQIHKGVKGKVLWRNLRVKELKPNIVFVLVDDPRCAVTEYTRARANH